VVPPHRPTSRRRNPLPAVGEESNGEEREQREKRAFVGEKEKREKNNGK